MKLGKTAVRKRADRKSTAIDEKGVYGKMFFFFSSGWRRRKKEQTERGKKERSKKEKQRVSRSRF